MCLMVSSTRSGTVDRVQSASSAKMRRIARGSPTALSAPAACTLDDDDDDDSRATAAACTLDDDDDDSRATRSLSTTIVGDLQADR